MRRALRGALLVGGVLAAGLVAAAPPAGAWQVAACVYADTTATGAYQPCVARSGGPSLPVVSCHAYSGVTQVPFSTFGAVIVVNAFVCT